jgi:hypothetical protein
VHGPYHSFALCKLSHCTLECREKTSTFRLQQRQNLHYISGFSFQKRSAGAFLVAVLYAIDPGAHGKRRFRPGIEGLQQVRCRTQIPQSGVVHARDYDSTGVPEYERREHLLGDAPALVIIGVALIALASRKANDC